MMLPRMLLRRPGGGHISRNKLTVRSMLESGVVQCDGSFKDVRFYPILNFGLFWASLFSMFFTPIMNFGHFWAALS